MLNSQKIGSFTYKSLSTISLGVGTFLIFLFWNNPWLYPLKIFSVLMHESGHLLATLLTGGQVIQLVINSDESGHVISNGGFFPIIAGAGYGGTALWGWLFIKMSQARRPWLMRSFSFLLFIFILINTLFYVSISSVFAFFMCLFYALFFALMAAKGSDNIQKGAFTFLGVVVLVYSFNDIRDFIYGNIYQTDAGILAHYWGFIWLTYPIAFLFTTLTLSFVFRAFKQLLFH